ncbi:MAG: ATP-binding protein [Candidatus Methylomirabilia bacterium]
MKKILTGVGAHSEGSPFEQGRAAAGAALSQAGALPPALALVVGRGSGRAAEILRGARAVLGDCPLVGVVSDSPISGCGSMPPEGVRVFLIASPYLRAKVGIGDAGEEGLERLAREAFRDSFITAAVPNLPFDETEKNLYRWYLYRRPSLALAVVVSPPGEGAAHELRIASFIRRRLHERVPLLLLSIPSSAGETAVMAGGRVVTRGVVLAMIKTDLKFSLERFHSFEPVGVKLFVTHAEGDRVFECNRQPALAAYCEALGIDPAGAAGLASFSLFPLAVRGRDGRFKLLRLEEVGVDGSLRFPTAVEPDRVLYPMKAVPSSDLGRASARHEALLPDPHKLAAAVFMRDIGLRDLPEVLPGAGDAVQPVEIPCGRELKAFLSTADVEGEAGHLLLTFERELDPFAVAAAENERLLREVVQLKDLHQKIFDGIGFGIAVVDASRHIRFCNNTYRILLTGSPAELDGRICPWTADGTSVCSACACEESIRQDAPVNREVIRIEGGKTHWYRLDTFPLRDVEGKVTAAIEVMRDVTAFKDLRFSLESEQRKMEAVIRGMGETLYIVDSRYNLQFFHRGAFPAPPEAAGDAGDVRNRTCYDLLFRRKLPCPWCCMHETLISGSVERRVAHLADEAGEDRSYQVTFSPWGVGQGDQAAVVCLLVDISAQKRLEQQMVLSEKLNSLSILSAGMAHELNNPLGAINFNLEILKRRENDAEYREVLESIRKDVLRINRIVGNLLSFSRSGAASSGWIALPEVIDVALELFQVVIGRQRIEVRRSYAAGLPPVWGNAQDLQQVFINLIANAVDAMPAGGALEIAVEVDSHASKDAQPARVAVVYDNAGELACLRALVDVPGWEVRFFRGDGEAIDSFRESPAEPPEVLLLDFADTAADRVDFFVTMVKDFAPEARVFVVADANAAPGDQRWARIPGIAGVLARPLQTARVLEQMRGVIDGLQAKRQRRAELVVRFSDTGVGIPPEILARIFDPFYTTKEAKGTGLGLSVVHKILETHGAAVQVSSNPGKGTGFTLTFPLTQAAGAGSQFQRRQENGYGRIIA